MNTLYMQSTKQSTQQTACGELVVHEKTEVLLAHGWVKLEQHCSCVLYILPWK